MKWAGHVALMGRCEEMQQNVGWKANSDDSDAHVDGRILLKQILGKCDGRLWTGFV
jgi:hypothetical protein